MNTNEDKEIAAREAWKTLQSLCQHAPPKDFIEGLKINLQSSVEGAMVSHPNNTMTLEQAGTVGEMTANRFLFVMLGVHHRSALNGFKYE